LSDESLPPKDAFYSQLTRSGVSNEDYLHAQNVWSQYNMKSFWDYHDLYLQTDVVLLADVLQL